MFVSSKDIEVIDCMQRGLPLGERPFKALAGQAGISEEELLEKTRAWKETGVIRRFGALLAHRRLGFAANGMVVWRIPEDRINEAGSKAAGFDFVSHCYSRQPAQTWPYNFYVMIHGRTREEVLSKTETLADAIGFQDYEVLFSVREFKKTRMHYFEGRRDNVPE